MSNQVATNFKISDPQKTWGKIFGYGLVIGILGLIGYYVLPIITTIAWNAIQLAIAGVVAFLLYMILSSKKFWLGLELLGTAIARYTLGLAIELDPWNVLLAKVEQADEDRADLLKHIEKLSGQESKLATKIYKKQEAFKIAEKKVGILKDKLSKEPSNESLKLQLESVNNDYLLAGKFVKEVSPVRDSITNLINIANRAYEKSGVEIKIARSEIETQKEIYEAVTTGSNAMAKAMRAFTGRAELNDAADVALEKLRADVGLKIGKIKTSIKITSQFMNDRDLEDAARVEAAVEDMKLIADDPNATVAGIAQPAFIAKGQNSNPFINYLK